MSLEDNRSSQEVGTDLEQPVELNTVTSQDSGTDSEHPADLSALTSGTPESTEMSEPSSRVWRRFRVIPWRQGRLCKGRF